jgi:hypothetical protein
MEITVLNMLILKGYQGRFLKLTDGRSVGRQESARGIGDWLAEEHAGNSNVEQELLIKWLKCQGHDDKIIGNVLRELDKAKALGGSKNLYDANREVYGLLRYGVKVKPEAGEQNVTVWLVDWKNPANNDFAIAEEVNVAGVHDKRPDLVLYLNGIHVDPISIPISWLHYICRVLASKLLCMIVH